MFPLVALMLLSTQPLQPVVEGMASYYTVRENGVLTASGESLRDEGFTCAMNKGEFGKHYLVVADNGNSVVCKLNDRGPHVRNRVVDLSRAAMRQLHPKAGLVKVRVYALGEGVPRRFDAAP